MSARGNTVIGFCGEGPHLGLLLPLPLFQVALWACVQGLTEELLVARDGHGVGGHLHEVRGAHLLPEHLEVAARVGLARISANPFLLP